MDNLKSVFGMDLKPGIAPGNIDQVLVNMERAGQGGQGQAMSQRATPDKQTPRRAKRPVPIQVDGLNMARIKRPRITPTTATTPSAAVYGRDNDGTLYLFFESPQRSAFERKDRERERDGERTGDRLRTVESGSEDEGDEEDEAYGPNPPLDHLQSLDPRLNQLDQEARQAADQNQQGQQGPQGQRPGQEARQGGPNQGSSQNQQNRGLEEPTVAPGQVLHHPPSGANLPPVTASVSMQSSNQTVQVPLSLRDYLTPTSHDLVIQIDAEMLRTHLTRSHDTVSLILSDIVDNPSPASMSPESPLSPASSASDGRDYVLGNGGTEEHPVMQGVRSSVVNAGAVVRIGSQSGQSQADRMNSDITSQNQSGQLNRAIQQSIPANQPIFQPSYQPHPSQQPQQPASSLVVTDQNSLISRLHSNPKIWETAHKVKKGLYRCTHCPASFARMIDLARHVETFKVKREFLCASVDCPWRHIGFTKRSELVRHTRHQHLGKTSLPCDFPDCGKVFPRLDSLKRHHLLVHQNKNSRANRRKRSEREKKGGKGKEAVAVGKPLA